MAQQQVGQSPSDIEMAQLSSELKAKLKALESSKALIGHAHPPSCPIVVAKVRDLTRNVDSGEYDPNHVAIGPYNHHQQDLAMEHVKVESLQMVLSAARVERPGVTVDSYLNELARLEKSVRNCYANEFDDIAGDQFVRMLLLDGCYILSRLVNLRLQPQAQPANNAPAIVDAGVPSANRAEDLAVARDVCFLAENQIPFFVLEKIGELTTSDGKERVIKDIAEHALNLMRNHKYVAPFMVVPDPMMMPGNLLHLLHTHLKPVDVELPASPAAATVLSGADSVSVSRWRSATEYSFAGVTFKCRDMSEKPQVRCILDVNLGGGGGTLEVPCLNIDGETWRLLRNLMELEQRNRETVGSYVTAYCVFMSQLACTTKDVELLWKKGIIVHAHGNNDEVADCFADLCKGIQFNPNDPDCNYLRETCWKLEKRSQSYWRRWIAWLRRKYFRNPWLTVGLLAAAIGLVCTVIQAVFSVLSYKHGN